MILDELILHNYGLYRGRQSIRLTPPSAKKPVVLFGGLNGSGKTTLLDAIHLALYGKQARCSNRGSLAYAEFLQKCVHESISPAEGAAVELAFRHTSEGVENVYRIHRSWQAASGGDMRERVEVLLNDRADDFLTESWSDHVHEFLPVGISNLFLFDGEKIEALADPKQSGEVVSTAIRSLLGLDLVSQLGHDLEALERRKRSSLKTGAERAELDSHEQKIAELAGTRERAATERAVAQTRIDRLQKRRKDIAARFRRDGGQLFEQRKELEAQRASLARELEQVEEDIRRLLGGAAPLLVCEQLLEDVARLSLQESDLEDARRFNTLLGERDEALLAFAKQKQLGKPSLRLIDEFLERDRATRIAATKGDVSLGLSQEARDHLFALRSVGFRDLQHTAGTLFRRSEELVSGLEQVDRRLAAVPTEDAIGQLIQNRDQVEKELHEANLALAAAEKAHEVSCREHAHAVVQRDRALKRNAEGLFEHEETGRVVAFSDKVRSTLVLFRAAMLQRNLRRIETSVLESFRSLLRKGSLVSDLRINPETYEVLLTGAGGDVLTPDRLSAGERQLLATSLLWGLARSSGRPLPTVIDTPLGRLDSSHRTHLVERYFPFASHQVILLSTDEEIDAQYFDKLKDAVGRSYRLDYDDKSRSTTVSQGYFWS